MTSQSSQIVRGPRATRSMTARKLRPIKRWISCVRPPTRPRAASRAMRVGLDPGSIPYSAVTHPFPVLRRNGGTSSSTVAVQMTRVSPISISTAPGACRMKPGTIFMGRSCVAVRRSIRIRAPCLPGFITILKRQANCCAVSSKFKGKIRLLRSVPNAVTFLTRFSDWEVHGQHREGFPSRDGEDSQHLSAGGPDRFDCPDCGREWDGEGVDRSLRAYQQPRGQQPLHCGQFWANLAGLPGI